MRHNQYATLMQCLDNALTNGYDDVLEQEPGEVYAEIIEQTGIDIWNDVPQSEIESAIRNWQERHA